MVTWPSGYVESYMLLRLSPGSQVPKSQVAKYKLVTPLQNYHHRGNKRMESNYLPQVCILLHCLCSRLWRALQDPGHHCLSRFSLFFASLPGEDEEPPPPPILATSWLPLWVSRLLHECPPACPQPVRLLHQWCHASLQRAGETWRRLHFCPLPAWTISTWRLPS